MSEMNNNESLEPKETEKPVISEVPVKTKQKKSHHFLYVLLVGLIAFSCAFAGAYLGFNLHGASSNTVIYKSSDTTASAVNATYTGDTLTTQQIAALNQSSAVAIYVDITSTGFFNQAYTSEAAGSGVIISSDGYIVTNNHVIEDASSIHVTLDNGDKYDATLIGTDTKTDIAVIKIDATGLVPSIVGDSSTINVGDKVVAIGNPLGTLNGTVTDGIISALSREITIGNETFDLLQTDAAVNNGNSGGGLFNDKGELIGIINAKSSGTSVEGIGFAIPINDVTPIVEQLIDNGYVDRATLGVYLSEVTTSQNGYEKGVYISEVINGSGADKAGLQAYDRITGIDDTEVTTYAELSKELKNYTVGDTVKITVVRNAKIMSFDVTLTSPMQTNKDQ